MFLWAYQKTNYTLFYDRAYAGISTIMDRYAHLRWVEYFSTEQARMLLPLAWLVRVNNTALHRFWLKKVSSDFLSKQHSSGAIQEWLGDPGLCEDCPPANNNVYGTSEGPAIQENGDTCADFLYTQNFALLGLHEAVYAVPDEPLYSQGVESLVKFIIRTQISAADKYSYLDGAWYRAFDFERWEYFGSSTDWLWGPWCIESGWIVTWIPAVLGFRQLDVSMWDFTQNDSPVTSDSMKQICSVFLPSFFCK